MTLLEKYCDLAIDKYSLFHQKDKLLLACSTGKDSTALFHYLNGRNYNFEVAHINYNLREASDRDASFIREISEKNKIKLHIKNVEEEAVPDSGVQEWARNLRYAFFHSLASANGYDYIITAHSLDDYLETYLMNIGKGRNLWNGPGIAISRGNIRRPLLLTSSEQVYAYLNSQNFNFREDKSNKSDKYERNRIRKYLIPSFKKQFPAPEQAIRNLIHNNYLLHSTTENTFDRLADKYIHEKENGIIINIKLKNVALLESFLMNTLLPYGFHPDQINQLIHSSTGSEFTSATHELLKDREELHLRKLENTEHDKTIESISEDEQYKVGKYIFSIDSVDEAIISSGNNTEYVEIKEDQFPLRLRLWDDGDVFQPLGMHGHKKIKSFLTDLKVDLWTKKNTYVLEDNRNEIIWVIPYRISENVKFKSGKNVFKLQWIDPS